MEDQGNKMSRSFMRQACHCGLIDFVIMLLLLQKNMQTTLSPKINLNTRVAAKKMGHDGFWSKFCEKISI